MKTILKIIWLMIIIILIFTSCDENITIEPEEYYGVTGVVMDTVGIPLNDVSIYCLFSYDEFPYGTSLTKINFEISNSDSFGFKLYQNFPNPVYNSAFVRFSIPEEMEIELMIENRLTGSAIYNFNGHYSYGLYQHYLNNLVSASQIKNGYYLIKLKANQGGNKEFSTQEKLFVVSDLGKPNAVSSSSGIYLFNYADGCIGDTIISTFDGNSSYPVPITNEINLLFKKDGYEPEVIKISLFPKVLITNDVILKKMEVE